MTRPADRVRGASKCRGSGRIGSILFKISRVGSGWVKKQKLSPVGSGLGSKGFKISRVGSGRVKRFWNLAGKFGSGQEVFKMSQVGSGHDP